MAQLHDEQKVLHPGEFIRTTILSAGMSVSKAAKLLGVARPTLSNLLNGKAAVSQNMAIRLERVFNVNSHVLIDLQSKFDLAQESRKSKIVGVHAPSLVEIKAREIANWGSSSTAARELLPVLVRRLIHSTGTGLTHVDFPGHEQVQRSGWDGEVHSKIACPWIPEGWSGWEVSCQQTAKTKANEDYKKRIETIPLNKRRQMSFVFVTSVNWLEKKTWVEERKKEENWKEVRAFDASDLEQWIEQSGVDQVWLAEQFGRSIEGFETIEKAWKLWSEAADPPIVPSIFPIDKKDYDCINEWLLHPPETPFIVSADTTKEALAGVCYLISQTATDCDIPSNRALVVNTTDAVERFTDSLLVQPHIAIVHDPVVEENIGGSFRRCHLILAKPNSQIVAINQIKKKFHVRIGLPSRLRFSKALKDMGLTDNIIQKYANESGRSPTVLQRLMSPVSRINKPPWCKDVKTARIMLPFALVGIWQRDNSGDLKIIRHLTQKLSDEEIHANAMELQNSSDPPLWSIGNLCGVVSRIDALFGVYNAIRQVDLDRFLEIATSVLDTAHPSVVPSYINTSVIGWDQTAVVHSKMIRRGIRETLTILSVHGNVLLQSALNMDVEQRISSLVRSVLSTLNLDNLKKRMEDLPDLAEAAPEEFFRFVEKDLRNQNQSIVLSLLRGSDDGFLNDESKRCHLLWALERLAWKNLGRVSQILAQLARIPIHDNLNDRPINSLQSLYRWWWPQTSASISERVQSLNTLVKKFPDIGWQVCTAQFKGDQTLAWYTSRPQWRDDAVDFDETTSEERAEFKDNALAQILEWPTDYKVNMLETLVELIPNLSKDDQANVWRLIEIEVRQETDDFVIAAVREKVRQCATTPYGWNRGDQCKVSTELIEEAEKLVNDLKPSDPVREHAWLFESFHVELSNHTGQLTSIDYEEEQKKLRTLRANAVKDVWETRDIDGIINLMHISSALPTLGNALSDVFTDDRERLEFLSKYINRESYKNEELDGFIRQFLRSLDDRDLNRLLDTAISHTDSAQTLWLMCCAPCCQTTWNLLNRLEQNSRETYWKKVQIDEYFEYSREELKFLLDQFLEGGRADVAFFGARRNWTRIDTDQICRILFEFAQLHVEHFDHYGPQGYEVAKAIKEVSRRRDALKSDVMLLEWIFLPVFELETHDPLLLERTLASSPVFFVWILMIRTKWEDQLDEIAEFGNMLNSKLVSDPRSRAFELLKRWSHIPGIEEHGDLNEDKLKCWIKTVCNLCEQINLRRISDRYIGQILARGSSDTDGIWPCKKISAVMEEIETNELEDGFVGSILDARGIFSRNLGEGGDQERALAQKYQDWAIERHIEYPFVGSCLNSVAKYYRVQALEIDLEAELERRVVV